MGVPALFRWLSKKYPKIISPVIEEQPKEIEGEMIPVNIEEPNPNGFEYDNLYLDMNNIIHPCSHPEDRPAPANEEEMMVAVFEYIERLVNMVRPRKLLMMAIDGVAPRAKMNQQRMRRFRAAKEAKEKDEDNAELLKLMKQQNGGEITDDVEERITKKTWDSNSITPGTPFMRLLAKALNYWVQYKQNTDPAWRSFKVIVSTAAVPGEGEHKIMHFIRSQRSSPEHDPNTRHAMYGLDADLIMLGLVTHEPRYHVLREDVFFQETKGNACRICGQQGHYAAECKGEAKKKVGEHDERENGLEKKPYIWLNVGVLREYLECEMYVPNQPFRFDLERVLDDWVMMCYFVGNDFLPHLPSLEIREDAIDTLIAIWREVMKTSDDYLTKDGILNMAILQKVMAGLAKQEDGIFRRRQQVEERKEQAAKRRKLDQERRNNARQGGGDGNKVPAYSSIGNEHVFDLTQGEKMTKLTHNMVMNRGDASTANKSAAAVLKSQLMTGEGAGEGNEDSQNDSQQAAGDSQVSQDSNGADNGKPSEDGPAAASALGKRKADLMDEDGPSTPGRSTPVASETAPKKEDVVEGQPDTVRLWEDGYADRYYQQKFHIDASDIAFRNKVAKAYTEGLQWVLLYYLQGCPSWTWYYPYHYAPFAADFVGLEEMDIKYDRGRIFKPYEQLMGVMPAASKHTIPEPFHPLMTGEEGDIVDFYPEDFAIDMNGKKFSWQGVALLPFIDENRLMEAMNTKYPLLTEEEHRLNEFGEETLLFSDQHPMYQEIANSVFAKNSDESVQLNARRSDGLSGTIEKDPEYIPLAPLIFPLDGDNMPDLDENHSVSVFYKPPEVDSVHKSMLLRGAEPDPPALNEEDKRFTRERALNPGRGGRGGGGYGGGFDRRGGGRGGRGRGGYDRGGFEGGRGGHGGHRGSFNGGNGGGPRFQPDPHRSSRGGSGGGDWRNPIAPHLAQYGGPPPPRGDFRPPPPQFGAYGGHPPPPPPGMGYPPGPPQRQQNGYQQFQGGRSNGHSQGYDGRRDNHYGGGGGGGGRGGGGYRGGGGGGGRGGGGGYQGGGGGGHRDYNNTYGHRHGDRHRDGHHGGGGGGGNGGGGGGGYGRR